MAVGLMIEMKRVYRIGNEEFASCKRLTIKLPHANQLITNPTALQDYLVSRYSEDPHHLALFSAGLKHKHRNSSIGGIIGVS
jgi:hypothetical protein